MSRKDYKDIFNETYYAAREDGASRRDAERDANQAAHHYLEQLHEQADMRNDR